MFHNDEINIAAWSKTAAKHALVFDDTGNAGDIREDFEHHLYDSVNTSLHYLLEDDDEVESLVGSDETHYVDSI